MGGPLPDSLYNLSNLKQLMLQHNTPGFEGYIKTEIGNLRKLTHIALSDNPITGTLPSELGLCKDLGKMFELCVIISNYSSLACNPNYIYRNL